MKKGKQSIEDINAHLQIWKQRALRARMRNRDMITPELYEELKIHNAELLTMLHAAEEERDRLKDRIKECEHLVRTLVSALHEVEESFGQ
jgi:hypothetical protein